MTQLFVNNANSVLAAGITASATSLSLAANTGSRFPTPSGGDFFLLTLFQMVGGAEANYEIVKVTARSIDTLTIVRGQDGTTARAYNSGDQVSARATAGTLANMAQLASGGTFAAPVYGPTAAPGDSSSQLATTQFATTAISAAVSSLVNSSPATLDTLKELADAIGDDPNYAATTAAALGNRLRVDAVQSLTGAQQTQAKANLALVAADVGLGNVQNTADADKPVSTATATALAGKAALAGSATQDFAAQGLQMASQNTGPLAGLRNYIINGAMRIAQRGAVNVANGGLTFGGCDRFALSASGFSSFQGVLTQSGGGNRYVQEFRTNAATTGGSTGATVSFQTRLEAKDTASLNGKTVTFSLTAFQSNGNTLPVTLRITKPTGAGGADDWSSSATVAQSTGLTAASGVQTPLSFTATLGSTDASNGLQLTLIYTVDSTLNGKTTYFNTSWWQLEQGPVATPLENRPYGMELALCQRYYWKTFGATVAPANGAGDYAHAISYVNCVAGATYTSVQVRFPVQMRVAGGVTFYNPVNANSNWYNRSRGADSAAANPPYGEWSDNSITIMNPQVAADALNQTMYIHMTVSAEL